MNSLCMMIRRAISDAAGFMQSSVRIGRARIGPSNPDGILQTLIVSENYDFQSCFKGGN